MHSILQTIHNKLSTVQLWLDYRLQEVNCNKVKYFGKYLCSLPAAVAAASATFQLRRIRGKNSCTTFTIWIMQDVISLVLGEETKKNRDSVKTLIWAMLTSFKGSFGLTDFFFFNLGNKSPRYGKHPTFIWLTLI